MNIHRVSFRVTDQEWDLLEAIAKANQAKGPSEIVAMLMRRDYWLVKTPRVRPHPGGKSLSPVTGESWSGGDNPSAPVPEHGQARRHLGEDGAKCKKLAETGPQTP